MLVIKEGIIYLQIYEYFKNKIINGEFKKDEKLPSKRHLADLYKVSVNSVQHAYEKLWGEGYIYTKERSGYYVANIDKLIVLEESEKVKLNKNDNSAVESNDAVEYDYDLTQMGVAEEGFPYKEIRKIATKVIEDDDILTQVDYQGYKPLREEIAKYLKLSRGFDASVDQIVISSGIEYLLQIIFRLVPGLYAIEDPGYPTLENMLDAYQVPYVPIPLDDDGINREFLFQAQANLCFVTPTHQFPTGVIMSDECKDAILNNEKIDYIVEDDYDSEFRYEGSPKPALKAQDVDDKVIYVGSFSKTVSPAFRVSYMVLPKALIEPYKKIFNCFVCPVSIIVQKILAYFIKNGAYLDHINKMRKIYEEKRAIVIEELANETDIEISGAECGLHLVLKHNGEMKESELVEKAKAEKVKINGLSFYGRGGKKPSVLIGYASLTKEELREAIKRLKKIYKK